MRIARSAAASPQVRGTGGVEDPRTPFDFASIAPPQVAELCLQQAMRSDIACLIRRVFR